MLLEAIVSLVQRNVRGDYFRINFVLTKKHAGKAIIKKPQVHSFEKYPVRNYTQIAGVHILKFVSKGLLKSSHQRYSMKKGVLKNFTKFTGKHLCQGLFLNKVAGLSLQLY